MLAVASVAEPKARLDVDVSSSMRSDPILRQASVAATSAIGKNGSGGAERLARVGLGLRQLWRGTQERGVDGKVVQRRVVGQIATEALPTEVAVRRRVGRAPACGLKGGLVSGCLSWRSQKRRDSVRELRGRERGQRRGSLEVRVVAVSRGCR